MDPTVAAQNLPGSVPPIDMSIVGMFMNADWIVKIVVIMLILASFWSWAIIFDKLIRLRGLRAKANQFEETFWSGISLEDLYDRVGARPDDPMSSVFSGAMREWRRTVSKGIALTGAARAGLQQRIEQVMGVTVSREMESLEKRMIFLASVGSTAPFIGLFGTVWGILRAFQKLGGGGAATIDIVGPDIANALVATAVGLAAAIPAVIAFNYFNSSIRILNTEMDNFSADFLNIVKRHLR